jgi:hypothetical protein
VGNWLLMISKQEDRTEYVVGRLGAAKEDPSIAGIVTNLQEQQRSRRGSGERMRMLEKVTMRCTFSST